MRIVVTIFASLDIWWLVRVCSLLVWLEEWGIPQPVVERALMVLFLALFNLSARPSMPLHERIWINLMLGSVLLAQHLKPEVLRILPLDPGFCAIRGFFQMLLWAVCALTTLVAATIQPYSWRVTASVASQVVFLVFLYSASTRNNGQRGRRRKLAMDKLKALFGDLGWLPVPVREEA